MRKMKIENLQDLRKEKERLRMELRMTEEALREDFEWIREELKPVRAAGRMLSKVMINKDHGIINDGVRFGIDTILKKVVLAKAGWITRLIVPFILKNLSSNIVQQKKPEIFGAIRNFIHRARKATHTHSNNHSSNHYDKSTVDEMDY